MNHKQKTKLARKMMSNKDKGYTEIITVAGKKYRVKHPKTPVFQTKNWEDRAEGKRLKQERVRNNKRIKN